MLIIPAAAIIVLTIIGLIVGLWGILEDNDQLVIVSMCFICLMVVAAVGRTTPC